MWVASQLRGTTFEWRRVNKKATTNKRIMETSEVNKVKKLQDIVSQMINTLKAANLKKAVRKEIRTFLGSRKSSVAT